MIIAVAPNAFKGSLTALQAADAIAHGLERSRLRPDIRRLPLADGGDGTLDVLLSLGGTRHQTTVIDPLGRPIAADFGFLPDGQTAVIEMARASGLALIAPQLDPLHASTYGTGQLIQAAIGAGAQKILLGVGGSATTDGGAGCLAALGVRLLTLDGAPIPPGGAGLSQLAKIEPAPAPVPIQVLCDVDNPPIGEHGAAAIFSPQKGATPAQVAELETHLTHFFTLIAGQTGRDVRTLPGGGAAGALAGGLAALAGAEIVPGAETIIGHLNYESHLRGCDWLITGEGQIDGQTAHGKAPAVIARLAARHGIPAIAIGGSVPENSESGLFATPLFAAMFSLMQRPATLEEALQHSADWLEATACQIGNLLALHGVRDKNQNL